MPLKVMQKALFWVFCPFPTCCLVVRGLFHPGACKVCPPVCSFIMNWCDSIPMEWAKELTNSFSGMSFSCEIFRLILLYKMLFSYTTFIWIASSHPLLWEWYLVMTHSVFMSFISFCIFVFPVFASSFSKIFPACHSSFIISVINFTAVSLPALSLIRSDQKLWQ